jgi:hypothetical protein
MEGIPGVEPTELTPEMPDEWITAKGKVVWTQPISVKRSHLKCEDCLRLILAFTRGIITTRPPGLSRRAVFKRRQGRSVTVHCQAHRDQRIEKENGNG